MNQPIPNFQNDLFNGQGQLNVLKPSTKDHIIQAKIKFIYLFNKSI
jgi:hypothetical protein